MTTRRDIRKFAWIAVAGSLILLVLLTGDWVRRSIGQDMRFALCVTGAALFAGATLAYIFSPARPFGLSTSAWVRVVGAAVLVGFLMFILFVQDIECELRSTGKGLSSACHEIG